MPVQIDPRSFTPTRQNFSLSERLADWSNQLQQQSQKKQAEKYYEKGKQAAAEGDMPEKAEPFLGFVGSKNAEAFNKGARDAYIIGIDRDNTEEVNRLAAEADGDAGKFNDVVGKYRASVLSTIDPVARTDIQMSLDSMVSRARTQVQTQGIKKQIIQDKETRSSAFETYSDEASRLTRNDDLQGARENLIKAQASLQSMVVSGDISQTQADEMFTGAKKELFRQDYKRDILNTAQTDIGAAFEDLDKIEKEVPEDYTPDEWELVVDDIRVDVSRLSSRINAGTKAYKKKQKDLIKEMENSLAYGYKLSDETIKGADNLLIGSDFDEEYRDIKMLQGFSVLPADKRKNIVEVSASRKDLGEQQKAIKLQKANEKLNKMAEEDGYTLSVKQGWEPIPLDIGDPISIGARVDRARELTMHYGVDVRPFSEPEVEGIARSLEDMTATEKTDLVDVVGVSDAVWKQLDKKNAGVFAMMGATGRRDVADAVFYGQDLLKTKQAKPPTFQDYAQDLSDMVGEAGEVYGPQDRENIIKAAIAYHATKSPHGYDDAIFEEGIRMITGGIASINGRKIELPRDVSEDAFEDFVDDLQPEILDKFGGLRNPYPIEDIKDGQFISIGAGQYNIDLGNGIEPAMDGSPFVIEINPDILLENKSILDATRRDRIESSEDAMQSAIRFRGTM